MAPRLAAKGAQFKVGIELEPAAFIVAVVSYVNELCLLTLLKSPNISEEKLSEIQLWFLKALLPQIGLNRAI